MMRRKKTRKHGARLPVAKLAALDKMVLATGGLVVLVVAAVLLSALNSLRVAPGEAKASAQLYKNPNCNCCDGYAAYLRNHGYAVATTPTHNLSLIRREHGVPGSLAGCHTTIVAGYVVEGHVPVGVLDKLLAERPRIKGISLPGMPDGSPGMTGTKDEPFTIYEITDEPEDGPARVYAIE
jgi:hypothetical protein